MSLTFEVRKEPAQTVTADDTFPNVAAFDDAVVQDLAMGRGERKRGEGWKKTLDTRTL